ncbi:hypothetical protein WDU94_002957 [Cyamophila willieti]
MTELKNELDVYRKKCTFDVKELKKLVEDEEVTRMKEKFWDYLAADPIFSKPKHRMDPHALRKLNFIRALRMTHFDSLDYKIHLADVLGLNYIICCQLFDGSLAVKLGVWVGFFRSSVFGLGSDEQRADILPRIYANEIKGCVAMTEVGHGTNVKQLQTRATYDVESEGFYIHSPDFSAAKCWVGNLAWSSTHAALYAQLILPNGVCEGVHAFLIPVRDPTTGAAYPGLTIGDMGDKEGMNGLDNGFIMFKTIGSPGLLSSPAFLPSLPQENIPPLLKTLTSASVLTYTLIHRSMVCAWVRMG